MKELIIISDTHIAKIWDKLDKIIPKKYNFLNPNYFFKKLIKDIKKDQLLIINGDLVDYYYSNYNPLKNNDWSNNWDLFSNILSKCKGKYFLNLGNHDYRKIPYNFNIYGLWHVNIYKKTRWRYDERFGHVKFRFLKELESIKVNLRKFNPFKNYPLEKFYHKEYGNHELIFLNTGQDASLLKRNILNFRIWPTIFLPRIASRGLNRQQMKLLKERLGKSDKKNFIIFIHCPALFPTHTDGPVKINRFNYWRVLRKRSFNCEFVDYNWRFVNALLKSKKNIIVISSHTHIQKQFTLQKSTKTIEEGNIEKINELRHDSDYVKFISTLPLGAIEKADENKKIGFLTINQHKIKNTIIKDFSKKN